MSHRKSQDSGVESAELAIKIGESILKQLAVTRILDLFELLHHTLAREAKILSFTVSRGSFRSKFDPGLRGFFIGLGLLRFDGLTFPTARHS